MTLKASYIQEPMLFFNKGGLAKTPCFGLLKYGPRSFPNVDSEFQLIKVGVIGTRKSISLLTNLFDEMREPIIPKNIKPWRLPFPGLSKYSPLKFSICLDRSWTQTIVFNEIDKFNDIEDKNDKIEYILEVIENKMRNITSKETPPNIIVICIPGEVENEFSKFGLKKPLIKLDNHDDFHNRIKVYGMKDHIPTQLIRWTTLIHKGTQDKATLAWNLAVGILYKAQRGHPWKLAKLEENTCYVGVSFYKEFDKDKPYLRTSLAQVFLDTGESFILRGDKFEWTNRKWENSPHLNEEDAAKLIEKVVNQYIQIRSQKPLRIVLHKSSNYWDDEFEGFKSACGEIQYKDFITIQDTIVRFFRPDKYSIMRGTLISIDNCEDYYLFTTGFVPSLKTYPGLSIPKPVVVRPKILDSQIYDVCEEILALTKLDWNNISPYRRRPVTMDISERVGHILAESEAKNIKIDSHYYFYM